MSLKSATECRNKLKSPWLYNHSSRIKDFNSGFLKVNITYTGQWYWTSCDKNGSLTPDSVVTERYSEPWKDYLEEGEIEMNHQIQCH